MVNSPIFDAGNLLITTGTASPIHPGDRVVEHPFLDTLKEWTGNDRLFFLVTAVGYWTLGAWAVAPGEGDRPCFTTVMAFGPTPPWQSGFNVQKLRWEIQASKEAVTSIRVRATVEEKQRNELYKEAAEGDRDLLKYLARHPNPAMQKLSRQLIGMPISKTWQKI